MAFDNTQPYATVNTDAGFVYYLQGGVLYQAWNLQVAPAPPAPVDYVNPSRSYISRSAAGAFTGLTDASGAKLSIPYALSQSSVPVGIPSSGSIANNGALSGLTAFTTTYSGGIYLYFPANAIVVGQAAGLYWTVMSGVSAGTIFNNTYTGGEPAAPAAPTPFVTVGPLAYVQTTAADITLRSIVNPGGAMGARGVARITGDFGCLNSAGAKSPKFMLSGNTFGGGAIPLAVSSGAILVRQISNRGTASQVSAGSSTLASFGGASNQYFTVDTSVDSTFSLTAQMAVATDWIVLEHALMEIFPS